MKNKVYDQVISNLKLCNSSLAEIRQNKLRTISCTDSIFEAFLIW